MDEDQKEARQKEKEEKERQREQRKSEREQRRQREEWERQQEEARRKAEERKEEEKRRQRTQQERQRQEERRKAEELENEKRRREERERRQERRRMDEDERERRKSRHSYARTQLLWNFFENPESTWTDKQDAITSKSDLFTFFKWLRSCHAPPDPRRRQQFENLLEAGLSTRSPRNTCLQIIRIYHPDQNVTGQPEWKEVAEEITKVLFFRASLIFSGFE